jgi:hypothetical protein
VGQGWSPQKIQAGLDWYAEAYRPGLSYADLSASFTNYATHAGFDVGDIELAHAWHGGIEDNGLPATSREPMSRADQARLDEISALRRKDFDSYMRKRARWRPRTTRRRRWWRPRR